MMGMGIGMGMGMMGMGMGMGIGMWLEIFLGSGLASAGQTRQGGGIYLPVYSNILDIEIFVFFVIHYSCPGYTYGKPT